VRAVGVAAVIYPGTAGRWASDDPTLVRLLEHLYEGDRPEIRRTGGSVR
jgi:hypothetical protein